MGLVVKIVSQTLGSEKVVWFTRRMTKQEVKHYILDFIGKLNSQHKPANYKIIQLNIKAALDQSLSLGAIQIY
ncbi:unnamed protein product, partial [Rotaria socialis]